eukprot:1260010-Amphidinium_carterae.1
MTQDEVSRSDHEEVLAAVQRDWRAWQFAAEALKGDCKIVLAAVRGNGCCPAARHGGAQGGPR